MDKCECWEERPIVLMKYGKIPVYSPNGIQICNGTKEREECTCGGDVSKCDFYPEKRKEGKHMKTAEMWLKAQEDGCCYEMVVPQSSSDEVFYQKDEGLFDGENFQISMDSFESFDEFMNEQWRLRTMTKSEAEAKFNIKIVED